MPELPVSYETILPTHVGPVSKHDFADSRDCTLVLDLDETLIHCSAELLTDDMGVVRQPAMKCFFQDTQSWGHVYVRPFAKQFLEIMSSLFEVVVLTASTEIYAGHVMNMLDPNNTLIHHRLFRQHCVPLCGTFVKDLRLLGRPMNSICLVDNSPVCLAVNPNNAILCSSYFGSQNDQELIDLMPILQQIRMVSSRTDDTIPRFLNERFAFAEFLNSLRNAYFELVELQRAAQAQMERDAQDV